MELEQQLSNILCAEFLVPHTYFIKDADEVKIDFEIDKCGCWLLKKV